jgi:hypothetical protein
MADKKSEGGKGRKIGRNVRKYAYRKSDALKIHREGMTTTKTTKEKRNRGPMGVYRALCTSLKLNTLLYQAEISNEDRDEHAAVMQYAKLHHIRFATPKAARSMGSLFDVYEAQFERMIRAHMHLED